MRRNRGSVSGRSGVSPVLCAALVALAAVCWAGGYAGSADRAEKPRFHVGFRILRVPRESGEDMLVALWYPTRQAPGKMKYVQVARYMAADAARDAKPAGGAFPLVIFSHGGGGCATNGAVFAEELASRGFVVAGADHADEFTSSHSDGTLAPDFRRATRWILWAREVSAGRKAVAYQNRPREISATIDAVLKESADERSPLHGLIDGEKIGMMGISFGAWTTLAVSGTIPIYHDRRIKAAAPIAGPAGKGAMAGRMGGVRIPIMLVFGEEETVVLGQVGGPRKTASMELQYEAAQPPKFLVGIRGARHLDFGGAGAGNRTAGPGKVLSSAKVRAEDPVIRTVNTYLVAFFQRYLCADGAAEKGKGFGSGRDR